VRTASVSISGTKLVVAAAPGARDNFAITRPSASTIRVTDLPSGSYTGSGVHAFAGCTRSGDHTANCPAAGITLIDAATGNQPDKVVNSTAIASLLHGGADNDRLTGGPASDTLVGQAGVDVFNGRGGNDLLVTRDGASDGLIACGAGANDKANLDPLPADPDAVVTGCETKQR
jgi:Ca2+-binding RTX toxin-like protein